ncbi:MAG: 5'/3'-nucleotidase SurE [Chloroflexi bacterium]|nr:5'/3'-nucleotidase SurE [Chloroflexota bacterium]
MARPLILLTNDDGVQSPGLAASAAAADPLGDLLIVAPSEQQSSTGRSMPRANDGRIRETRVSWNGQSWPAYAANASPAQAVQHALLELAERPPALAISGINFGENLGFSITISGTVGAALEAASHGIPALAVSQQVDWDLHFDFDNTVDFAASIHFTRLFARRALSLSPLPDVSVLKIDVPDGATPETAWRVTQLEGRRYYRPIPPERKSFEEPGRVGYEADPERQASHANTDVAALLEGVVSVTPLSQDLTSRIQLTDLQTTLSDGLL